MKRMVVIADLHCGQRVALTPPGWQYSKHSKSATHRKYAEHQELMWKFYYQTIEDLKPIDILVCNGDAIDGKGYKSGGTEQITTDRNQQVVMAQECIELAEANEIVMTHGTPYHTGGEEDYETPLAKALGAQIVSHHDFDVNGVIFNIRHFTSRSVIPHGRNTGPSREALWDLIWAAKKGKARADVLIRSHVHYFVYGGDSDNLVVVTPCFEGPGSKYGTRVCSGIVDIGLVYFDVEDNGEYTWDRRLMDMSPLVDVPTKLGCP